MNSSAAPPPGTDDGEGAAPPTKTNGAPRNPRGCLRRALPSGLLVLTCVGLYANALGNGFVGDDNPQILRNPWIADWRHLPDIFSHSVLGFLGGESNYYRPLMHVCYLLTDQFVGRAAWGFHALSLLLHALNTLLVYRLALRLRDGSSGGASPLPFLAALLFAAHPVHSEAVAWAAALPELLYTAFFLTAVLCLAAVERPFSAAHWAAAAAFFFGLLGKETTVCLLAFLPVCDLVFRPARRRLADYGRLYAPFLLALALYLALRLRVFSGSILAQEPSLGLSAAEMTLNVVPLVGQYLLRLLVPLAPNLRNPFPPVREISDPRLLLSLPVVAAFVVAAFRSSRSHRVIFFALALIALPLAPALYLKGLSGKLFAERYLYLPSAGFVIAAACALEALAERLRNESPSPASSPRQTGMVDLLRKGASLNHSPSLLPWLLVAPLLVWYAAAVIERNTVWRDSVTLLTYEVAMSPDDPLARYDLAVALGNAGRLDAALAQYRLLVAAHPDNGLFHSGLGGALIRAGQLEDAVAELRQAIALDPGSVESFNDLGVALRRTGRTDEAVSVYRQGLAVDPNRADTHHNLGVLLADLGRTDKALEHLAAAVRSSPDNAYYRSVLGIEYAKLGRTPEAIEQFEAAVRLDPNEPAYRRNLERARRR